VKWEVVNIGDRSKATARSSTIVISTSSLDTRSALGEHYLRDHCHVFIITSGCLAVGACASLPQLGISVRPWNAKAPASQPVNTAVVFRARPAVTLR
jgi:hypothetical protein